jgi:outer membrane immunogenic protein
MVRAHWRSRSFVSASFCLESGTALFETADSMRKLMMIAAAAAFAGAGGADAADLGQASVKDDIYAPAPVFSWTGFYVGGNGGYGWASEHQQVLDAAAAHMDFDPEGGVAGGQVGVNWQPRSGGGLVVGAEGSLEWTGVNDRTSYDPMGGAVSHHENRTDLRALGDVSGRLGFALDRTLIYAKGGVAWGQFDHSSVVHGTVYSSRADDRVGWLVGGGLEFAFSPNWSVKVEYNYIDFGAGTYALADSAGYVAQSVDYNDTVNLVKGGVNYRFGAPQAEPLK